jgi:hypothetical protein
MQHRFLEGLDRMPLVIEPENDEDRNLENLLQWSDAEHNWINEKLLAHGALLFRGFDVEDASDFNRFAEAQGGALQNYIGGDSPRREVENKVYTSTEFAEHLEIYLHNELSYAGWYPSRVFFYCNIEPASGGQTTIGDSREIFKSMRADMADRFANLGVAYIQNLHSGIGPGKSWQETYETDDRQVVEAHCQDNQVEYRWTDYGLWTRTVCSAVNDHPVTGQRAWFNQADQFHAMAPSARIDPDVSRKFDEERYPCHATYGDGSEISLEDLSDIRSVFADNEVLFSWQRGDVLMLDNLIAAHGRKPYTGDRKILVAMS